MKRDTDTLSEQMYTKALHIAHSKIRGGPEDPVYKKPFVDAAFSPNIFLWDTCFIACYAKYHAELLPIANALDNFYERQDDDGHIGREYTEAGAPVWPKEHPVSTNPPLLAFAELQLFSESHDRERLRSVFPKLKRQFDYLTRTYRGDDGLFFGDALGSGMDNIPRYPPGWQDDGQGIGMRDLHPGKYVYRGPSARWNRQGRSVDMSSQMALFAEDLVRIARHIGANEDIAAFQRFGDETRRAINGQCWDEADGFYFDLGYGEPIRRMHIGMFWTLLAGVASEEQAERMISHLTNPREFWQRTPAAAFPANQPGYSSSGDYWLGGVWAPTNYMVLLGLLRYGRRQLAQGLARQYYAAVASVYRETGTFFENYAPASFAPGNPAKPDFCGWTGIVPISIYREFLASDTALPSHRRRPGVRTSSNATSGNRRPESEPDASPVHTAHLKSGETSGMDPQETVPPPGSAGRRFQ